MAKAIKSSKKIAKLAAKGIRQPKSLKKNQQRSLFASALSLTGKKKKAKKLLKKAS